MHLHHNTEEPSFLLLYSPQQFNPKFGAVKPEGSLGILYLAAALRDRNYEVGILDCCVGNDRYSLDQTFYRQTNLPGDMIRIGFSPEEIIREVRDYDVIGISSIFTAQTAMVKETVRTIAAAYPEKIILLGGVNARSQIPLFLDAGASVICLSEAERTIVEIGETLRNGSRDFSHIAGIAYQKDGQVKIIPMQSVEQDLDMLPYPAWDLAPLNRYWKIARPHGGSFSQDNQVAYASAMTSRGCPFNCAYCHISGEHEGSLSGNIRQLRLKSLERVLEEMHILQSLGVRHVFMEDDSLLAKKKRALEIFREMIKLKLELSDVNGINLAHLTTTQRGQFAVDEELLETMSAAGFKKLIYPVESGSQRILNKYATGKLNLEKHNVPALIRKAKQLGMEIGGNYTFGYPDETYEEIMQTFVCAKEHRDVGLDYANFMIITPFPGTQFYDLAMRENLMLPGVELGDLDWTKPSIKTLVPSWVLEFMITHGWEYMNDPKRITRLRSMASQ